MSTVQVFCSVNDLVEDQQSAGASESRWYQAIRDASDFLQKEIGWFIPVTMTRAFHGHGENILFVPALLSVSAITNDGQSLSSTDYLLQPDGRHWANGPYSWLMVDPDAVNISAWADEDAGVSLTGQWGLFLRLITTGATVASNQSDSALTLVISDGGKVSPGMSLLIGSEQMLVTGWDSPTLSVTTLNGAINATDQIITVADGTKIKTGEIIRVDFEQMKVRDIRTNQAQVIRAWNGSGQSAHLTAAAVDVYRTVSVERAINGTTAAAHTSSDAVSRYTAPDDVQFLTKQIATLMLNKAKSGYQGRTGDAQTGVVFYNDAIPRFEIDRIRQNYYIPRSR